MCEAFIEESALIDLRIVFDHKLKNYLVRFFCYELGNFVSFDYFILLACEPNRLRIKLILYQNQLVKNGKI